MAASTRLHWPFYLALRAVLAWLLSTRVPAKADVMARTASRLLENDRRLHECMYVRVLELLPSVSCNPRRHASAPDGDFYLARHARSCAKRTQSKQGQIGRSKNHRLIVRHPPRAKHPAQVRAALLQEGRWGHASHRSEASVAPHPSLKPRE